MKIVKIKATPPQKGMCPARPPLGGLWRDGVLVASGMEWCALKKGHEGKHTWEPKETR